MSAGAALGQSVRRLRRHFGHLVRRERPGLVLATLALLAEVALRALEPWPLKFVFDTVLRARAGTPAVGPLALAAVALVAIVALRAGSAYASTMGFSRVGNRILTEVREQLYAHLTRLPVLFHARQRSGDLVVRMSRDVDLLKEVLVTAALPLAGNFLVLAAMLGLMAWLEWRLTLLVLALLPLFWLVARRLTPRIHDSARGQRRREGRVASRAAEAIGAIRVVQALALEGEFGRAFREENRRSAQADLGGRRLSAALERSVDLLVAAATALVLAAGAALVLEGALTPGTLLVFLAYLKSAFKPLQDIAKYSGRLAKAAAAGDRIVELLEEETTVQDRPGAVAAPALRGAISFEAVRFGYQPGAPVLDGVSLALAPGDRVALLGPSGSGKTTLASLVLRLFDPAAGQVRVDGHDLRDLTLASLRRQVSVVLQDTLLFHASIRENIALGAADAPPEAIEAAARLASAHEFILALPDGYDTVVGERGATLSAGQRQRIAIARAALRRAPIVILAEPTTGLDGASARAVTEALERLTRGVTTIIITHDPAVAAIAERTWRVLPGGQVREEGAHALAG